MALGFGAKGNENIIDALDINPRIITCAKRGEVSTQICNLDKTYEKEMVLKLLISCGIRLNTAHYIIYT